MKLDEFVEKALLDITNGVSKAQEKSLLYVAPGLVEGEKLKDGQYVKFDVSVSVSSEAGGGISIFSVGAAEGKVSQETLQRISFEVPVYFQAPTERNERHFSKKK